MDTALGNFQQVISSISNISLSKSCVYNVRISYFQMQLSFHRRGHWLLFCAGFGHLRKMHFSLQVPVACLMLRLPPVHLSSAVTVSFLAVL